jgi:SAM-dependent methyltransferase
MAQENNPVILEACPLCRGSRFQELFKAAEYVFAQKRLFSIVMCLRCRFVFLNPQPSEEELYSFYPQEYYAPIVDEFRAFVSPVMGFDRAKEVARLKAAGTLLDIGCGLGGFLQQMQKNGWQVHGIDMSAEACSQTAAKIGQDPSLIGTGRSALSGQVFQGDIFSVSLPLGYYDCITLWHVIEHVFEPQKVLRRIAELLKEDGVVVICCPNFDSWNRMLFKGSWYPLSAPHHLWHFTYKTLVSLLASGGFRVSWRRKHFIDPMLNMGSLKLTLLRFLGLGSMTRLVATNPGSQGGVAQRPLWWCFLRFCCNMFCLSVATLKSLLGNEETILVAAQKNPLFKKGI